MAASWCWIGWGALGKPKTERNSARKELGLPVFLGLILAENLRIENREEFIYMVYASNWNLNYFSSY